MRKLIEALKNIYYVMFPPTPISVYKKMGARIGKNVYIANGVTIDPSHAWLVKIGDNVGIAPFSHILAHDGTTKGYLNYARIGIVELEDNVIIGARCTILPGVKIGKNSIIGTGSVVVKDIPENCIAAGNPAKVICSIEEYVQKQKKLLTDENCFDESYTLRGNITEAKMKEMIAFLEKNKIGFVV
jgi:maltose O-acetyltransferase